MGCYSSDWLEMESLQGLSIWCPIRGVCHTGLHCACRKDLSLGMAEPFGMQTPHNICHHSRLTAWSPVPVQLLRKKGLASADKKAGRIASEGLLKSYIHAGARCASALEAGNCS